MLARTLALAVSALALVTPAHAGHATFDCGYSTISQDPLPDDHTTFSAVAHGFVVSPAEDVSIRCYITVDGVESPGASTDPATGMTAAVTAGVVTFTVVGEQPVAICAEWSAGTESGTRCTETKTVQEVVDEVGALLDDVGPSWPEHIVCPVLVSLTPGVPDVVDVTPEGDVAVLGEPFWDCPPYGSPQPGGE